MYVCIVHKNVKFRLQNSEQQYRIYSKERLVGAALI